LYLGFYHAFSKISAFLKESKLFKRLTAMVNAEYFSLLLLNNSVLKYVGNKIHVVVMEKLQLIFHTS
jgi:hypothetical protein